MRSNYDDLMGLEMYDDGMGQFYTADMLKDQLIAAGSSAAAIILAAWAMPKLPAPKDWQPVNQSRMRAALGTLGGMLAARGLWDYNRDAAMAVLGGVAGLGLAQLIDSYLEMDILHGTPLGQYTENALSAGDEALLTAYAPNTTTLSLTEVGASRGAFAGFAGTGVTTEQLMGAVVATETLGDNAYNAYLS
jgi:hypothetical protein